MAVVAGWSNNINYLFHCMARGPYSTVIAKEKTNQSIERKNKEKKRELWEHPYKIWKSEA